MSDNPESKQLVRRVKAGETGAFQQLVEKYQHLAFTVAYNIVKNREDAEEVVSDAFIKVYRNIVQHNETAKFSSWLYKIVYNTALSRLRKKKLEVFSLDASDYEKDYGTSTPDGWNNLVANDQKKHLQKARNNLAEPDKLVLTLFYLAEEGLNEICEITEEKKSTVKVRLHRARARLYDQLCDQLKEEVKILI